MGGSILADITTLLQPRCVLASRPTSGLRARARRFFCTPPHCLKKNATPASRHWSRMSLTHSLSMAACAGARFSADDHPVDAAQVDLAEWPEQRLDREELDVRLGPSEVVDAREVVLVLDAHAHPDVRCPRESCLQSSSSRSARLVRTWYGASWPGS